MGIAANDRLIDSDAVSVLSRADGLIFLCFFVIFMYYSAGIAFQVEGIDEHAPVGRLGTGKSVFFVLVGIAGLAAGGHLIVVSAVNIALRFGLSESFVGLTIVAVGTSLPELATSVTAAYRKNLEIAVGNVVGSNIFNIFFILGISAVVRPLPFPEKSNYDVAVVIAASVVLFATMFTGKRRTLEKWEGVVFILLYLAYTGYLVSRI